jgi:hypothetical protein
MCYNEKNILLGRAYPPFRTPWDPSPTIYPASKRITESMIERSGDNISRIGAGSLLKG